MRMIEPKDIFLREDSNEELLPDRDGGFPYQALKVDFYNYNRTFVPWHWHKALEIFYVKEGFLEYRTPNHVMEFPPGSGGIINSNILHGTSVVEGKPKSVQFVHQVLPVLLSGNEGGKIDQKYFKPYLKQDCFEILGFYQENPEHRDVLALLKESFDMDDDSSGFEFRARYEMSRLWLKMIEKIPENGNGSQPVSNETLLVIMRYIYRHYHEKIYVKNLADAAYISERECYRLFAEHLDMSPGEYIQSYRIQAACNLLINSRKSVTDIGQSCGLGSSSYFGKIFREKMGVTPVEYRRMHKKL